MAHQPPTYDDANLILRLFELRREDKMREARAWFTGHCYAETARELMEKYPMGSEESRMMRMVVTYWEMVASFLNSGVLNKELFYDNGREMLLVWFRLKHLVPEMREMFQDQSVYKNLEAACRDFAEYIDRQSPGAAASFEKRVISMVKR